MNHDITIFLGTNGNANAEHPPNSDAALGAKLEAFMRIEKIKCYAWCEGYQAGKAQEIEDRQKAERRDSSCWKQIYQWLVGWF